MNLKLKLFKDELPVLTHYSSSYGGQWSSDWIVVFTPGSDIRTTKYIVAWSTDGEPVSDSARKSGNIGKAPWYRFHKNSAWCYSKDVEALFSVEE